MMSSYRGVTTTITTRIDELVACVRNKRAYDKHIENVHSNFFKTANPTSDELKLSNVTIGHNTHFKYLGFIKLKKK